MHERRHARSDFVQRLELVAALEHECVARRFARLQHQLRGRIGVLLPQRLDLLVGVFPFWNGRAPIGENRGGLRGRTFFARQIERVAHVFGQRVGLSIRR